MQIRFAMRAVSLLLLLAAGVVGCGGGQAAQGSTAVEEDPTASLPWEERVQRGQAVYQRACNGCHPGGEKGTGPAIVGEDLTVEQMTTQIRNGTGKMPAISPERLPDRFLGPLMAYLASLKAVHGVSGQPSIE